MSWGSVLSPVLFDIFINDLDESIEGILIKSANNMKLGKIAGTKEDRHRIQNDLDQLNH